MSTYLIKEHTVSLDTCNQSLEAKREAAKNYLGDKWVLAKNSSYEYVRGPTVLIKKEVK